MAINRAKFFSIVPFGPSGQDHPTDKQRQGIDVILDAWVASGLTDLGWLAYMLATVRIECGSNMWPVREGFQPTDEEARRDVRDKRREYAKEINGQVYYGRGFVQLTWLENYDTMGKLLNLKLVSNPDLALDPVNAAQIMIRGMTLGLFTPKEHWKLSDFFNGKVTNWKDARQIINGHNKAVEVAAFGKQFHSDLEIASQ